MDKTVLCYIENNKNEYLMLLRNKKKNDMNEGKWLGIGGHIEEGETKEEAVKREVMEETGLLINDFSYRAKLLFINDSYSELIYLFTAKTDVCSIIDCDEGYLKWINKNDVLGLNLWEGDKEFLNELVKHNDYFEMKLLYSNDKFIRSEKI